ncbi:MAG: ADP-ribosylglycohydrolase family protein [Myxococcaceae bacterium]
MPPPKKKVKAPTAATTEQIRARQKGALLGLAVGEAMGIRTEQRNMPAEMFPTLNEGPIIEPMGGGRFELRRGQVTWGAEMAQVLSTTLRNLRRYDLFETAKAYARWMQTVPPEVVPAPIKAALDIVLDGRSPENSGRRVWLEGFQKVRDNAALVRTVVLGVFFHARRDDRVNATLEDTGITHFDPLCQLANATLNGIIAAAIGAVGERLDPAQLLKVAEAELSLAAATLGRKEPDWVIFTKEAADFLREDLKFAQADDPELYGPELHLFHPWPTPVRTTYRLAFWELFHAPSLEAALIDVTNRGGDADTNAAVTGALFGAIFGESAVPAAWVERVMEAPGNGHYHPRNLVTLAGLTPEEAPPAPE